MLSGSKTSCKAHSDHAVLPACCKGHLINTLKLDLTDSAHWHSYLGLTKRVPVWQALPFYDESVADLQAELEEAVQAAIACMPVETQDNITDVDVSQNAADYAERLASANYQLYSQATIEEKHCLTVEGCVHTVGCEYWLLRGHATLQLCTSSIPCAC